MTITIEAKIELPPEPHISISHDEALLLREIKMACGIVTALRTFRLIHPQVRIKTAHNFCLDL